MIKEIRALCGFVLADHTKGNGGVVRSVRVSVRRESSIPKYAVADFMCNLISRILQVVKRFDTTLLFICTMQEPGSSSLNSITSLAFQATHKNRLHTTSKNTATVPSA